MTETMCKGGYLLRRIVEAQGQQAGRPKNQSQDAIDLTLPNGLARLVCVAI
jgi:hypothetical protein